VTRVNQNYALTNNAWLTPTGIVDGRFARFGVQINF
jgi:hypothetical protein